MTGDDEAREDRDGRSRRGRDGRGEDQRQQPLAGTEPRGQDDEQHPERDRQGVAGHGRRARSGCGASPATAWASNSVWIAEAEPHEDEDGHRLEQRRCATARARGGRGAAAQQVAMARLSSRGMSRTTAIGTARSSHQAKPSDDRRSRKRHRGSPTSSPVSRAKPSASRPVTAVRRRGTLRWAAMSAWTSTDQSEPGRYLPSWPDEVHTRRRRQVQVRAEVPKDGAPAEHGQPGADGGGEARPTRTWPTRLASGAPTRLSSSARRRRRRRQASRRRR